MGLKYDPNRFKHYGNRSEDRLKNNYFLAIPGLFNFDDIYSSEVNRIKDGGCIAGHDYIKDHDTLKVWDAVNDFYGKANVLNIRSSWYIRK